jgi:hypothetical protein
LGTLASITSRVATIDPSTLTAQTHKKTCRRKDAHERIFIYEPRMGDAEEIEIDEAGVRPLHAGWHSR